MTIRQGHNVIAGSSGRTLQDAFPLFFDHRFTFDPQDIRWVNSEDYSWLDGEVYRGGYNKLLSQYQPTGIFKAASLNYTCVFSDLSIIETNVPVATGTVTDLQDWATAAGYTTTGTTIDELVVNKSLVSSSETIAEVVISFYRCYDKKKIVLTDQIAAVEAIYAATGIAEYFILDIANKQFKLPRNKWGKYGTGSGDLGDYISESLPNITGGMIGNSDSGSTYGFGTQSNGAFYCSNNGYRSYSAGSVYDRGMLHFDASRSSSTYQDDAPVQPRGARGDLYFYLGDADADIVGKAYVTDALIQSKANNSEVLHKTLDESFTGTKTGYGLNTPIALKRYSTYTEIQTQASDGTRTGGFRNIQETNSTVNQTLMYVADGSSYKGSITLKYDSADDSVWAELPKIKSFTVKKENNTTEGGQINFESGDTEVNAGKSMWIDRYNGRIRIVGVDSNDNIRVPFQADVQNDRNFITNATVSGDFRIEKAASPASGFGLQIHDNTDRNNISVFNYITSDGTSYGRLLNSAYDKNCYIDVKISSAGERTIQLTQCDYAYAPNPVAGATGTEITTASWVRTRMSRAVGKTGPTTITTLFSAGLATGNIPLSQPFTDFDAIYIWFAGDGNTETLTKLWYTWELDRVLKDGMHTRVLLFGGDSVKWYVYNYANGTTTSNFKLYSENCYINRVEGLIW